MGIGCDQVGGRRLVGYLPSHVERALIVVKTQTKVIILTNHKGRKPNRVNQSKLEETHVGGAKGGETCVATIQSVYSALAFFLGPRIRRHIIIFFFLSEPAVKKHSHTRARPTRKKSRQLS